MRFFRTIRRSTSFLTLLLGAALAGCNSSSDDIPTASIQDGQSATSTSGGENRNALKEPVSLKLDHSQAKSPAAAQEEFYPEVVIETSLGTIRARLNGNKAPRTVENFLYSYVARSFYDQTIVHYVERDYIIAFGGYTTDLKSKPTRTPILCESDNDLKNKRGTLAMAHHPDYVNSATSQFFINLVDNPALDYQPGDLGEVNGYCVFGEVIEGMDVLQKMSQVETHDQDDFVSTPVNPITVRSIRRVK